MARWTHLGNFKTLMILGPFPGHLDQNLQGEMGMRRHGGRFSERTPQCSNTIQNVDPLDQLFHKVPYYSQQRTRVLL